MLQTRRGLVFFLAALVTIVSACNGGGSGPSTAAPSTAAPAAGGDTDPPEVQVGERLFLETRFAEFFYASTDEDVNAPLPSGDPVMNKVQTLGKPLPGPFRGQSMNCRQCHLVDDLKSRSRYYVRSYCDFATRSPIPARTGQSKATTPRNSPLLVNATLARDVRQIFHFDGEFPSIEDLVVGTMTGVNFGWMPAEYDTAIAHIADVIRHDDGKNALAEGYGGGGVPYSVLFLGTSPSIPPALVIPPQYRIDVNTATDDQVVLAVASLIHAYMDSLRFSTDDSDQYNGSPYDVFLIKNNLPRSPNPGESNVDYSQRLLGLINGIAKPIFVNKTDAPPSASDGNPEFRLHKGQKFAFGDAELQGLKTFFTQAADSSSAHAGNCVACHTPPNFSDFRFHNNGASQVEYDAIFGAGAFAAIPIPDLATRNANFDEYLPPSANHPDATSRFRSAPALINPGYTDLGVWNMVGNPDAPNPQATLLQILCSQFNLSGPSCNDDAVLPLTIAYFKTPTLRDLGQSPPFLHNGSMKTLDDVIDFYVTTSALARGGEVRNASPEFSKVNIDQTDQQPLKAFLRALNEDYD